MKLLSKLAVVLVIIILLSSCTINRPICATSNPLGTKVGTHTQIVFLGFPPRANNDAAIAKAARNGGITKISTVDHNTTWKIFFVKYDTIVTGE